MKQTLLVFVAVLTLASCKKELLNNTNEVSGTITVPTTWSHQSGRNVDYVVSGRLYVQAALTIQPGTVIEFKEDAGMEIGTGGALIAEGTADNHITFTSTTGTYWNALVFYTFSDLNKLRYCDIRRGGKTSITTPDAMVVVGQNAYADGKVSIRDCVFESSLTSGLFINDQSQVTNFANNTFTGNGQFAITLTTENLNDVNGTALFSANGKNYVEIRDCVFPTGESQNIQKLTVPYYIQQGVILRGTSVINAGVQFTYASGGYLNIDDFNGSNSTLQVLGTTGQPVIFAGENGGSWRGIVVHAQGATDISYAEIKNGGGSLTVQGMRGGLVFENSASDVSIRDCVFDGSGGYGIELGGNSNYNNDIATANTFVNCTAGNINY